jgi:hypothetical protein
VYTPCMLNTRQIITEQIDKELAYQRYHNFVANILYRFSGKKITQRFFTLVSAAVKTEFGECAMASRDGVSDQNYLKIWGTAEYPEWGGGIRFFLGFDRHLESYQMETFEQEDASHGSASIERVHKLRALLDSVNPERTDDAIEALASAVKVFKQYLGSDSTDNPARYAIIDVAQKVTGVRDLL